MVGYREEQAKGAGDTQGSHPGLYYTQGDAYAFMEVLNGHVDHTIDFSSLPKTTTESLLSGYQSTPITRNGNTDVFVNDSRIKGQWPVNRRPLDLIFDSSVFDTLILQDLHAATDGVKDIYESMNRNHGAWLSVSYNDPESRLYIYRAQPWDVIIICRPKKGRNHLFWLLKGDMWKTISATALKPLAKGTPGSFSAGQDNYYTCELAPEPEEKMASHDAEL